MSTLQTDPFRDFDNIFSQFSSRQSGSAGVFPMDAFRRGHDVWVHMDLPGVKQRGPRHHRRAADATVAAERHWQRNDGDQYYFSERYRGSFRRQIQLGDGLDLEQLEADLHDGVLTIRIPVAEQAEPRKISVGTSSDGPRRSRPPRPTPRRPADNQRLGLAPR